VLRRRHRGRAAATKALGMAAPPRLRRRRHRLPRLRRPDALARGRHGARCDRRAARPRRPRSEGLRLERTARRRCHAGRRIAGSRVAGRRSGSSSSTSALGRATRAHEGFAGGSPRWAATHPSIPRPATPRPPPASAREPRVARVATASAMARPSRTAPDDTPRRSRRSLAATEGGSNSLRAKEPKSITRFLTALGEPTDAPTRSPSRGPPSWKSTVLRRNALGDVA
jgi:hypothetical protein